MVGSGHRKEPGHKARVCGVGGGRWLIEERQGHRGGRMTAVRAQREPQGRKAKTGCARDLRAGKWLPPPPHHNPPSIHTLPVHLSTINLPATSLDPPIAPATHLERLKFSCPVQPNSLPPLHDHGTCLGGSGVEKGRELEQGFYGCHDELVAP
jgi:hypothetical protein